MQVADHITAHERAGRHLVVRGTRTFVRDHGEGEAVVCMHGVPASSYLYRKVVMELARHGLRGIAFDLPGLGLAERPGAFDYTWSGLGRWSAAAIDALDLDRVHLVAHDIGGPVTFEMIDHLPERVASLTILNTITDPGAFTPPWVMRPFFHRGIDRVWLGSMTDWLFVQLMRLQGVADRSAVSAAELAAYRHLLISDDGGRAFLRIMKGFERTPLKSAEYQAAIRSVPKRQVIWGERDPALPFDPHALTARRVADVGQVHQVPGKHFLQEDHASAIVRLVAELIEGN
ncbi:alpha/beta fold hydrolase [Euzebya tangerina]|uniref:alpha/beta fold hydrolase n=1 Tax=Euzebya tangerina TaxID=591198 RepID=UPI000E30D4B7|nr:alpha/beta fold hydrolase [Euzebya tangerina]